MTSVDVTSTMMLPRLQMPSSSTRSSNSSAGSSSGNGSSMRVVTPTISYDDETCNSININSGYHTKRWGFTDDELTSGQVHGIRYQEVINYGRVSSPRGSHHCVMCGLSGVEIPSQNKDVCKSCDTSFWYFQKLDIVVKFCKGCKNFVCLSEFEDKPEASKCGRCRHRGRQNYFSKKKGTLNKFVDDYGNATDYSSTPSPEAGANLGKRKRSVNHTPSPPISELQNHISSKSGSAKVASSVGRPPAFPRSRKAPVMSSPYQSSPFSHLNIEQEDKLSPAENGASTLTKNGIASDNDGEYHRSSSFDKSTPKGLPTRSVTFGHLPSYRRTRGESDVSIESALSGIEVKQESNSSDPLLNPLMYLALLTGEVFGDGITSPLKGRSAVEVKKTIIADKENYDSNSPNTSPESIDNLEVSSNSEVDSDDCSMSTVSSEKQEMEFTPKFKVMNKVSDDETEHLVYS